MEQGLGLGIVGSTCDSNYWVVVVWFLIFLNSFLGYFNGHLTFMLYVTDAKAPIC